MKKGDKGKKILGAIVILAIIVSVFGGVVLAEDLSEGLKQSVDDAEIQTAAGNLSSEKLTEALDAVTDDTVNIEFADQSAGVGVMSSRSSYDPPAAVNYADTWWNGRNPNYHDYSSEGGDCANFVSQCLIAGGLDLSGHPGADSWGCIPSCTNLHDYLVNYQGATYETRPKSQKEPIWFVPGDPAIFPTPKHAVFAVTGDATHYATCNAHSTDRYHKTIQWFFDNSNWNSCTYYHIPTDIPQPPSTPTITSPGTSSAPGPVIDDFTPTLQWNAVSGADYYAIAIRKDPPDGPIVYNPQQVYGTSHDVPSGELEHGHEYRWNMQAHGSGGWSPISNTLYFQTPETAPEAPTITSPGTSSAPGPVIDDFTPTLQWNAVSGADYYAIAIRKDPPDGPIVYNPQQVYGTSHDVPSGELEHGHEYRWNMQAHGSGGWSPISNTLYFQTPETAPEAPTITSPGTSSAPGPVIDDFTPTLQWNAVSGADYYAIAIRKDPPDGPIVYNPQQVYGTSHDVPSGELEHGHEYRWNMQAHGSGGWSPISNTLYFQTYTPVNHPPELSNGYVTPSSGDTSSPFDYYVTYKDQDGDPPSIKNVYINGLPHEMLICETSSPSYPETIRVLRHETGQIDEVDFDYYVKNVLPNEWAACWDWDIRALKAGAMAVKTYAWYWTINQKYPGQGYDVRDDTWDQVYDPDWRTNFILATPEERYNEAVEETWNWVMMKNGEIFQTQYDSGTPGSPDPLYPGRMSQWGTQYWAESGKDWQWICHYYYDPITLASGSYVTGATFKYSTTLPAGSHNYYFYFDDGHGHTVRWPVSGTDSGPTVSTPNDPPNKPSIPSGPTSGQIGIPYPYSTVTTDPNSDNVYYWFDWGDDTNSGWIGPYTSGTSGSASKEWSNPDIYNVKAKAKDEHGAESSPLWSDLLPVCINGLWENDPINPCKKRRLSCTGEYEYQNKDDDTICDCTARNTLKRCYGGVCTDTGICDSTTCSADAACDGKEPGDSCGGGICDSNCKCGEPPVGEDIAVYIGRTFYISTNLGTSGEKGVDLWYNFGLDGAIPLVGDFNRDGHDDIAVYIGRTFYISTNLGASGEKGVDLWYNFGLDGAKPLVGDFNQDGYDDIAVYIDRTFYISTNLGTSGEKGVDLWYNFGLDGAKPLVGDFNHDGRDDIAVYIDRTFYISTNLGTSGEKGVDLWYNFGLDGAKPLVGDFNQDGYDDIAVYIGRTFYISTNLGTSGEKGVDLWYNFGLDGAIPLVGDIG